MDLQCLCFLYSETVLRFVLVWDRAEYGDYIAVLAWPEMDGCRRLVGAAADDAAVVASPIVKEAIREALRRYNAGQKGSSTRVERILLMIDPPDLDANEITDKGYINQRACLKSRAALVSRLFADPPGPDVIVR